MAVAEVGTPSPTNLADGVVQSFTASTTEVRSFALDALPADFNPASVSMVEPNMSSRRNASGDDAITLNVRIMSGSTVLAAADSAGAFQNVATLTTNTGSFQSNAASLGYRNTSASQALWDAAVVEVQQVYTTSMGNDADFAEIDRLWVRIQYEPTTKATAPTLITPANGATGVTSPVTFDWTYNGVGSSTAYGFRRGTTAPYATLTAHGETFTNAEDVTISPDGTLIAVAQRVTTGRVYILNAGTLDIVQTLDPSAGAACRHVCFSPDGASLYVTYDASPYLSIYNTSTWVETAGTPLATGPSAVGRTKVSANGRYLAIPLFQAPWLSVVDLQDGALVSLPTFSSLLDATFSPDSGTMAVVQAATAHTTGVAMISTATWTKTADRATDLTGAGTAYCIAWSPAGDYLAISWDYDANNLDGLLVLDTTTWTRETGPDADVLYSGEAVGFSPDGAYFGHIDLLMARVWKTSDWSLVVDHDVSNQDSQAIALHNDFMVLANAASPYLHVYKPGVANSWWDGAAFVAAETFITTADTTVTIPGWTEGTYEWSVASKGDDGKAGPYATPFTFDVTATASGVSGSITSTLPAFTTATAGTVADPVDTGSIASALPAFASAATGTVAVPVAGADVSSVLPTFSTSATGRVHDRGSIASTLPAFTTATAGATAVPAFEASVTSALPRFSTDVAGRVADTGAITSTLPAFGTSASGMVSAPSVGGSATSSLPVFATDAAGRVADTGSIASALPTFSSTAAGATTAPVFEVSATSALPTFSTSAAGKVVDRGSITSVLPAFTASAVGKVHDTGTATSTLPVFTTAVTGAHDAPIYTGSITGALPTFGSAAQGTFTDPLTEAVGTSVLPTFSTAAQGDVTNPAGITSTLPRFTTTVAGTVEAPVYAGTIESRLAPFASSAQGTWTDPVDTATIASTLPRFVTQAAGTVAVPAFEAAVQSRLPWFTTTAAGTWTDPVFGGQARSILPTFLTLADGWTLPYSTVVTVEFRVDGNASIRSSGTAVGHADSLDADFRPDGATVDRASDTEPMRDTTTAPLRSGTTTIPLR